VPFAANAGVAQLPDDITRTRMYHEIEQRIEACQQRFGPEGRHVRVFAVYAGSTGRPMTARISGTYFPRRPIGPCIIQSVMAVRTPPFRHAQWATDYSFWLH
jgi:hypothetical protein